jgi:hypothetical protein
MALGHEKLDVYRLSIDYVAWVYEKADSLNGVHRPARDQWLRASQSIPLKGTVRRLRLIEDVTSKSLVAPRLSVRRFKMCWLSARRCTKWKAVSERMNSTGWPPMLSRLGGRGYQVREDQAAYSVDSDPDSDFDPEERKSQQTDALDAHSSRQ